jgi:thiol:disulfide interchange protein
MSRHVLAVLIVAGCCTSLQAQSVAAPAAQPGAQAPAEPAKRKDIYDVNANAREQIAAALARAKKEHKRVLIQWGGNWCGWCHLLHDTLEKDRAVKGKLAAEYELVLVDAGREQKNLDLAAEYGAELQKHGYPFLTVLDSDGKVIANQETESLETPKPTDGSKYTPGHDAKKVLAFLAKHQAPPADAEAVLSAGLAEAQKTGRKVFLHFGAPWCGWCHKLEAWMARPEIEAILAKDYVDVKIDVDRMKGGKEVSARMGATGGIPWMAILDPSGKKLITSDGPKGNVGFPYQPEEVAYFGTMLEKTATTMTEAERKTLEMSLNANREADEAKRRGG